jgi:hypothetical protein
VPSEIKGENALFKRSDRIMRLRVGQADIPDLQFRKYLLVFFFVASGLFLWAPTHWLMQTFRDFSLFRSAAPSLAAPASEPAPLGAFGLLDSGKPPTDGALPKRPRAVSFRLLAPAAQAVYLGGTFNDFDARKNPLARRPDGVWETTLDLAPGSYHYKFKVDGHWELDPTNPEKTPEPRTASILTLQ